MKTPVLLHEPGILLSRFNEKSDLLPYLNSIIFLVR
jgi:hypothetical protein